MTKTPKTLDPSAEALLDVLLLTAANDGDSYLAFIRPAVGRPTHCVVEAAVTKAFREHQARKRQEEREDFAAIRDLVVAELAARWEATHAQ